MNRYFLDDNHSIQHYISADEKMLVLNTPAGAEYVDTELNVDLTAYWDVDLREFISIGQAPTPNHVFDYVLKQWIDPRTLDEIKAQRWAEIKSERDRLEFGGFEFDGGIYDSDQVSQGRIMGAAAAGMDQVWTLADNTTTYLTTNELVQLYQALQIHIAITHQRGRAAREAIMSATTKDDVDAVTL